MNNNKKFGRKVIISALVLFLCLPLVGGAFSKSYSFDISHQVTGSTKYAMANKATTATGSGQTTNSGGTTLSDKSTFKVSVLRTLKNYGSSNITANGNNFSRSLGTITKNDYRVNVTKTKAGIQGERVKGSGYIKQ